MYLGEKRVRVSGDTLVDAQATFQDNQPVVSFRFDSLGGRRFAQTTKENVGKQLAIVLDQKVISAPRIREPILGGSGIISGNFTVQGANDLALLLRSGERRVGKEWGSQCRYRWSAHNKKKKKTIK